MSYTPHPLLLCGPKSSYGRGGGRSGRVGDVSAADLVY